MSLRVGLWFVFFLFLSFYSFSQFSERPVSSSQLSDIFMVNTVGFAGGVDGIFKTTDGGQTWVLSPYFVSTLTTLDSLYFLGMNYHYLYFESESVGYSVGWDGLGNREIIIKTIDGGQTWEIQHLFNPDSAPFQAPEDRLKDIDRVSSNRYVSVGYRGRILLTTDGGANWVAKNSNTNKDLQAVDFYDSNTGIAAGAGVILFTNDGGDSWTNVASSYTIKDFEYLDQNKIVAITSDKILRSLDGGTSWTNSLFSAANELNGLTFVDASTGFISGNRAIYKTTDGGQSWFSIYSSTTDIHASSFASLLDGYFVTANGNVIITHDGGAKTILAPTVSGFTPTNGMEGNLITVSGTNLENVVRVTFNGTPSAYSYKNGKIESYVPTGATTGKIELTVQGGQTVQTTNFTVSQTPVVNSPYPYLHIRNYPLVLSGINLQYVHTVTIDSRSVPFQIIDGKLSITTESDLFPRDYTIEVTSNFGKATLSYFPIYPVPNPRSINFWSQSIGATGTDFQVYGDFLRGITAVEFEGGATTTVSTDNDYFSVIGKVPAGAISGHVKIHHPYGYVNSYDSLTIFQPPVIDSIRPLVVKAGDLVSIYGRNLGVNNLPGSVKFGESFANVAIPVDDTQLNFIAPSALGPAKVEISVFGGKTTSVESLTIAGEQPYYILKVSPAVVSNGDMIRVDGHFPFVDSVKFGSLKVSYSQYQNGVVIFQMPVGAVSAKVSLFKNGTAIASDLTVIVTDNYQNTDATITFNPKKAQASTSIMVNCGPVHVEDVLEFSLNDIKIPFEIGDTGYPNNDYRLFLPSNVTTGKLVLKTRLGVSPSKENLVIVAKAPPRIVQVWQKFDPKIGYLLLVHGENLEEIDSAFFDTVGSNFTRLHRDTLLIEIPRISDYGIYSTSRIYLTSPHGVASASYSIGGFENIRRDIIQAEPLIAKRGTAIVITLEPKESYLPDVAYNEWVNAFYFNGVEQRQYTKLNENQYLVPVPMQGDINGKIGVAYYGNSTVMPYTDFSFHVTESGPCDAASGGETRFGIYSMKLGSFEKKSGCSSYSDYSNTPIEVIPGQRLSLKIKVTNCNNVSDGFTVAGYIDWNDDKDFDDTDEVIFNALERHSSENDTLIVLKVFDVPWLSTTNYFAKMRFSITNYGTGVDCGYTKFGEVEDYSIHVVAPGSLFKISDFYPKITLPGMTLTIIGDNLTNVNSSNITVGGAVPAQVITINNSMMQVVVPDNAATGKIIIDDGQGNVVESTDVLRIDNTLPAFQPNQYYHLYGATLNGGNIALTYNTANYWPYNIMQVVYPNNAMNGILCFYGGSGEYCDPSTYSFPPSIASVEPAAGAAGDTIVITGIYLTPHYETQIKFNGVNANFTTSINGDRIEAIVPAEATTGKIEIITTNGSSLSQDDFVVYLPPTGYCNPDGISHGNSQTAEIVKVQIGDFKNTSFAGEYTDPDLFRSTYNNLEIYTFPGDTLEVNVTIQSTVISQLRLVPNVFIDWNGDFDFTDLNEHITNWDNLTLAYYSSDSTRLSVRVPVDVTPGKNVIMRITMGAYHPLIGLEYDPCISWGELEEYTLTILDHDGLLAKPTVLDFTPKVAISGSLIEIMGSNLSGVSSVSVNGTEASVTMIDDTHAQFSVPSTATSGYFVISDTHNTATSPAPLIIDPGYTITSISPTSGRAGDEITISGTNLSSINHIAFSDMGASEFTVVNSNTISVKVPTGAGDGRISIRSNNRTAVESSDWFYYCDGVTASGHCKLNQYIYINSFEPLGVGKSFSLVATATSNLPVLFTSSNSGNALIATGKVTGIAVGTVTIAASQPGNSQYYPATVVEKSLQVTKSKQVISFSTLSAKTYGDVAFTLSATSNSTYAIIYQSSNTSVATIVNNVVTIVGAGTTVITASQPDNINFLAATPVFQTLSVNRKNQTIAFASLTNKTFGDAAFDLAASASSNQGVTFTSSNSLIASISGSRVTILAAGSVQITANQIGNGNFYSAPSVVQTLTINKNSQAITFAALAGKTYGDASFDLVASTTSNLPVTFVSSNSSIASVSGNRVTILTTGTVQITASQNGNSNFNSAPSVPQTLNIGLKDQTINFTSIPNRVEGTAPFTLAATATSGLLVQFSTTNSVKISISGTQVNVLNAGSVTILANQAGNQNYSSAPQQSQTFCINPAKPVITEFENDNGNLVFSSSAIAGNQWYLDGNEIADATEATLLPYKSGIYTLVVRVDDCESEFSDGKVLVVTGISDDPESEISIHPNPVKSKLILKLGTLNPANTTLQIYDRVGSIVNIYKGLSATTEIDVSSLISGQYILKISQGAIVRYLRFTKI
jgi:photosystem II stability/assembly factor-like uncharacterized protein